MAEAEDGTIARALTLYAFGMLGVFLTVAPWTPVWDYAFVALLPTRVGPWVDAGWLRGAVSGLGVLDLVVSLEIAVDLWREWASGAPRQP